MFLRKITDLKVLVHMSSGLFISLGQCLGIIITGYMAFVDDIIDVYT